MHDGVSVFSPERMETLTCGHLRLVDDAEPAGVFVKRPLAFHGSGFAVEQHRFGLRMRRAPFLKSAAHTSLGSDIELNGETAGIVEQNNSAGGERGVPALELGHSRRV